MNPAEPASAGNNRRSLCVLLAATLVMLVQPITGWSDVPAPSGTDSADNPGYAYIERGATLWRTPRGKNNVSLEQCDLGEGAGKLSGAYARLPRYFADAGRVMDLEERLLWCMDKLQGYDTSELRRQPFAATASAVEMQELVTFVANKSDGMKFEPQTRQPKEREALAAGEALFYRRSASMDFSCATCHASQGNRVLSMTAPQLSVPGEQARLAMGEWPTYGARQHAVRSTQYKLFDCYREMRMPAPEYASDGLSALLLFLTNNAADGVIHAPSVRH